MMTISLVVLLFGACLAMPTHNGTTEGPIGSTTQEFIDCTGYRVHPNPNMYQVLFNEEFVDLACYGALIWNQDRCRCVNPPSDNDDLNCPNNRAVDTDVTKYEIRVWGVWRDKAIQCPVNQLWNQTGCRCDWDPLGPGAVVDVPEVPLLPPAVLGGPCQAIFDATFDESIKDDSINRYSVGRDPWGAISIDNAVEGAVGGGAARVDKGAMPLWFSAGNEFTDTFQIQLRFKVADNGAGNFDDVSLLSNACGYDKPSVIISYRALDQRYQVFFKDATLNTTLDCIAPSVSPFDFHDLSLEYQEDRLILKVDGSECFVSSIFTDGLAVSQCPITLGGKAAGSQENFDGYFDEVVFRRGCIEEA